MEAVRQHYTKSKPNALPPSLISSSLSSSSSLAATAEEEENQTRSTTLDQTNSKSLEKSNSVRLVETNIEPAPYILPQKLLESLFKSSPNKEALEQSITTDMAVVHEPQPSAKNEIAFEKLPIELIAHIMSFLKFNEKKNVSLVCKRWREAFLQGGSLDSALIKVSNQMLPSSASSTSISSSYSSFNGLSSLSTPIAVAGARSQSTTTLATASIQNSVSSNLYENVVNLDLENDSANVSLLLAHLKSQKAAHRTSSILNKLKTLRLSKMTMNSSTLVELLNSSPQLQSLRLIYCDSLFMTGFLVGSFSSKSQFNLANLTELSLSKNRYLTDLLLGLFVDSAPQLTKLDISYCCLTKSNYKSLNKTGLAKTTSNIKPSSAVLTLEYILYLVQEKLNRLTSINLSGIGLFNHDDEALYAIADNLIELTELYLADLPSIKASTIGRVLSKLDKLESIDLSGSAQSGDNKQSNVQSNTGVEAALAAVTSEHIKTIKLNRAVVYDSKLLAEVFSLASSSISFSSKLVYLDMSCALFKQSFVNSKALNEYIEQLAIGLSQCSMLEHLDLSYCDYLVNNKFIKIISRCMPRIAHLNLRNCTQISDEALHYIAYYLQRLEHLDISSCRSISDNGISVSINFDKNQRLLNEFNKHLASSCRCMRKYIEQPFLLLKTKSELIAADEKSTEVCNCAASLVEKEINNLNKKASISSIQNRLGEDEALIKSQRNLSLKNLKRLRTLRMESCVNVTDLGLFCGVNLHTLQELDIKLCSNLTGDFVNYCIESLPLSDHLLRNLRVFNINQCINFKEANILKLVNNAPYLRELNASAVNSLSDNLIRALLEKRLLLHKLDISFCSFISERIVDKYEQLLYAEFGSREFHLDKRSIGK
jgi:hypothetical protein